MKDKISANVSPEGSLEILSQVEVNALLDTSANGLYRLFRSCALAVLNTGSETDDPVELFEAYRDFGINLQQRDRGISLRLENAPATAFVDGQMIHGIREHLFAVLRDIIYVHNEIHGDNFLDLTRSEHITSAIFHILRNADVLHAGMEPNLIVGWGGHAIGREEYEYSKEVGYQLGLRGLDICTGCGPGAMKGPMKGAGVGHAKQRLHAGRYLGITEPGIVASEPPNPIVNELIIMPDIEKRLEAFVRVGHGIIIFPGGVGTTEEFLYILSILMHPDNADHPLPLILTGPEESRPYFEQINQFISETLGVKAMDFYRVIINDPEEIARAMRRCMTLVRDYRIEGNDAFYFNWRLRVEKSLQEPFEPTHESMASLNINRELPPHELAAQMRRAFSGIVAGNVKEQGIHAVARHGPFRINGDPEILASMDKLLSQFSADGRMKMEGEYTPCYVLSEA
ncbi:MAG: nucleotide 5'-monophosphate nucleosidase PpnN [Gammaproteobacteria bacterium]